MKRGLDYHIHTHYLKCAREEMTIKSLFKTCEKLGLHSIAITDHLACSEQSWQLPEHVKIKKEINGTPTKLEVFFGVEISTDKKGNLPYDEAIKDKMGFELVIAGIHQPYLEKYDEKQLISTRHKIMCEVASNSLVDIIAHPWWFSKNQFDKKGFPWFNDLSIVPEEFHLEFAEVCKKHNTAVEINATAIFYEPTYNYQFREQYKNYIALLNEQGVTFSIGSDAHELRWLGSTRFIENLLEEIDVPDERIWQPKLKRKMGR